MPVARSSRLAKLSANSTPHPAANESPSSAIRATPGRARLAPVEPIAMAEAVDLVAHAELGLEQVGRPPGLVWHEQAARPDLALEVDVVHDEPGDRLARDECAEQRDEQGDPAHARMEAKRAGRVARPRGQSKSLALAEHLTARFA